MDYNEDREGISKDNSTIDEEDGFVKMLKEQVHDENHATLHLDTMGNVKYFKYYYLNVYAI